MLQLISRLKSSKSVKCEVCTNDSATYNSLGELMCNDKNMQSFHLVSVFFFEISNHPKANSLMNEKIGYYTTF